jgi:hypothetical protein
MSNHEKDLTTDLHHQQSPTLGANINVTQVLVATQSCISPVIGKSDPLPQVTPAEFPVSQTLEDVVRPPPDSAPEDNPSDNRHEDVSRGDLSALALNDSTQKTPFSSDESRGKKRPAYFDIEDTATELCRLCGGNESLEEFTISALRLIKRAVSASHSCPIVKKRMEDLSSQAEVLFSGGEPPSSSESLEQLRLLLTIVP